MRKICIINNETKNLEELKKLFDNIGLVDIYEFATKIDPDKYDLYILSGGSHHSVFYEPTPYKEEIDLIKKTKKKVLGICLGAELIARLYGSVFSTAIERVHGYRNVKIINKNYKVFESHRFVIRNLGNELEEVFRGGDGVEIFRHKDKQIWGIQFHPEKTENGLQILEELGIIG